MTFTIEVGKTYQTRNGWTAEVMFKVTNHADSHPLVVKTTHNGKVEMCWYNVNGQCCGYSDRDILPPRSPSWWVNVYADVPGLTYGHGSKERANHSQAQSARRTHLLELGLTPDGLVEIRGQERFQ
jgi:hypothetical protein